MASFFPLIVNAANSTIDELPSGDNLNLANSNIVNVVNVSGSSANFTGNLTSANLTVNLDISGNTANFSSNVQANNLDVNLELSGNTANFTGNISALNFIGNISGNVTGDLTVSGNLTVEGNLTYINVETLDIEDPLISVGGGPNGAPLTTNDGKDRGTLLQYYTSAPVTAFIGWDNSNAEFAMGSNVTISSEVATFNTLGNVRLSTVLGNISGSSGAFTANVTAGNVYANSGTFGANILLIGSDANTSDFPNAKAIVSQANTGQTHSENIGLVGEAVADSANTNTWGIGVLGEARANGATKATGVQGGAYVTNSADTGAAVGVRGYSTMTHSGGYNIGVLGNAAGSGVGDYAFYIQAGDIASIEQNNVVWDLADDEAAALQFNSTGKANIFGIETTDGAEGIYTQGYLNVTGNANVGGIKTDNYYYSNGAPVDFQQAGGANTDVQFNDANGFGGSNAFTFNKTSNQVSMGGTLSVTGNANVGNIGATAGIFTTVAGSLTTGSQPNITSVGTLSSLSVTGNANVGNIGAAAGVFTANVSSGNLSSAGVLSVTGNANVGNLGSAGLIVAVGNVDGGNLNTLGVVSATGNVSGGNLTTTGVVTATGNVSGGNLTTTGVVTATGNVSGGNLTTTGALSVTGNANVGNIGATAGVFTTVAGTLTTAAQPNITSVGTLSSLTVTGNGTFGNILGIFANGTSNVRIPAADGNVNISAAGNANIFVVTGTGANVAGTLNATGDVVGANISTAGSGGNITGANVVSANTFVGVLANGNSNVSIPASSGNVNISAVGNANVLIVTGTGVNVTGTLNATGNLTSGNANLGNLATANYITGTLTTAAQPNITSVGTLSSLTVSGNITSGNVYANTGTIGAGSLTGTLTTAAQPNITSVGTLSSLTVSGNVAAGNLTTTGVLSVTGTGVSSIAGNLDMTSNTIINLATPTNANDAATKQYVDDVAQGLHTHDSCSAATPDTLANITSGTITYNNGSSGVGANLTTTGTFNLIDGVNVQTAGTRILVKNEANSAHNGIYIWSNATVITRATDFDTSTEMAGGDFTFVNGGTLYDNTGWVMTDSVTTVGTSPVPWVQFSGAGTYTAGTGLTLTGTVFSVNASQSQITSVGTLTGLGVNGNITAANITANTGVFTGNGSGLSALAGGNVTGQVANALVAGTVYTAAQSNITSVGTLTSLDVSGNIVAPNIIANTGVFTGNGNGLSHIQGANLTGTISSGVLANSTLYVGTTAIALNRGSASQTLTGTNIDGYAATVSSASQPNITSVGTLTSLGVTGNVTAGNLSGTLVTGTLTTAAQPNITSVGTLTSLNVSGNANVGNLGTFFVGASGNVTSATLISNVATGTAPLTVTSTTRVANLNVAHANVADFISVASVSTGTFYPVLANAATGNVSEGSNANLTFNAATGALSATLFTGTLTTAAQPNITSVGTLTSLTVSGAANIQSTTAATSTTTGALIVAGGIGANANSYFSNFSVKSNIAYVSPNGSNTINSTMLNGGTLAWSGNAGQLFSITDSMSGNIFSVNDVSGIPMITVSDTGTINLAPSGGFVAFGVSTGVSAAGSTQGTATALTRPITVVSTVSNGANGVVMPTTTAGMRVLIINTSANALNVYPATGGAINAGATNASYSLGAGGRLEFISTSTTQWYTLSATFA